MKSFEITLSILLLVSCSLAVDNIAVQFAQLNYQFLLVPLSGRNSTSADPTPNGLATGGARSIFLLHSCMYDAWAAYQVNASYSHSGNGIPKTTGNSVAVATSIAYAGYTAIIYIWGSSQNYINQARTLMTNNGYNPDDFNNNTNNAAGIGNRACYNILTKRQRDGYNEQGDETLSFDYGTPWSDFTNYKPVNVPQAQPIDCSQLRSQTSWVPLVLPTGTQKFSSIHMIKATPFALDGPFEFTIPGPNLPGTSTEATFYQEVNNVTNYSATLNDATKMSAEFWARSSGAALWEGITIQSARNAALSIDDTIKLFFAEGIGAYDAGISCWSHKRIFESMRPNSAVACYKSGNVNAWKGPYLGSGSIPSTAFQSYLVMPNFAEYPSGHSTWSGAASTILRNFFGSDTFRGDSVFIEEGTSVVEPKITSGNPGYQAGLTDVPNTGAGTPGYSPATNITLTWTTFSDAQNDAGISRLYGGFHFTAGDEDAKSLGRQIGQKAWNVAKSYWEGNPPVPVNPNNTPANTYTTVPQGTPDNVAIQFAQMNYNFLLKPLGSGSANDDSPNGLATGGARSLFILGSCLFDAWAVYKVNVTSSHPNNLAKMPSLDNSANIAKSIAFAGYTALSRFWRSSPTEVSLINNLLVTLGYSLTDANNTDASTPQGIGYLACKNVIDSRVNDGYNELGSYPNTKIPTAAWRDYTNFKTQNDAAFQSSVNCAALNNVYGWVPLRLTNTTSQPFSSIQMMRVKPFSLKSPFEYPMNGPNMPNTPRASAFNNEISNLLSYSANLNDTLKMIAEFWASSSGAAIWGGITIQSARNARLSLEDTVKLFFAEGVGSYDAGITCWSNKRIYQNLRPNTAIQCFGPTTPFTGWLGAYNGVGSITRDQFQPYMITPPFAEYPSGHSTWSGAAAVVLKNFFGDDTFRGDPVTIQAGTSAVEPKITAGNPGYISGVTDVPNNGPLTRGYTPAQNVTLRWSTWTEAQDEAGISRVYGGWHPIQGNIDATATGRLVGQKAWMVAQSYWINQKPSTTTTTTSSGTLSGDATTGTQEVSEGVASIVSFILLGVMLVLVL